MGKFIQDFKAFALKGNVIDMAVGVIVGGAFGKIVSSLVDDIIMPVITICTGNTGFENMKYVIHHAEPADAALGKAAVEEVAINYGMFIQNIVDFLEFMKKEKEEEAAPAPAPEPTAEEKLLTEIRDLLKEQK